MRWITLARRRAPKGSYQALASDVEGRAPTAPMLAGLPDCMAILVPQPGLAFGALFGFVGLLIAVPAAAAVGVLVRFAIGRYLDSPLYTGHSHPAEAPAETVPPASAGRDDAR